MTYLVDPKALILNREMNLILSGKAAKKLKVEGPFSKDFAPDIDTWRIDCASLVRRSIFIITNEQTLYTCISSYKNGFGGIIRKIVSSAIKDDIDVSDINYVKSQNKNLISSMDNMKRIINQLDQYHPSDNETYERLINQTPFKYLSHPSPAEVHSSNVSSRLTDS